MRLSVATEHSALSDDQWHQLILSSMHDATLGLPGFPSQYMQEVFVGKSHDSALQEAFDFYRRIKTANPISSRAKVLDFGVGWGRIIRYFSKDIPSSNLFGVDVDPEVLAECKRINIPGNLQLIEAAGELPYSSSSFDVVYSFSVFSHLSEASAKHWLKELMRVLRPNGTLVLTTTSDRFLDLCLACKQKTQDRNFYEERYADTFEDPQKALEQYRQGHHVYTAVGGSAGILEVDNYGWASMPLKFVEREVQHVASSIEFSDDPAQFEQAIFVIKKHSFSLRSVAKRMLGI